MVKRYELEFGENWGEWTAAMVLDDCGDYVHYDDYAALLAENERLKAERVDLEQFRSLASRWKEIGERHGVRTFTGNDHKLFANELLALIDAHKGE